MRFSYQLRCFLLFTLSLLSLLLISQVFLLTPSTSHSPTDTFTPSHLQHQEESFELKVPVAYVRSPPIQTPEELKFASSFSLHIQQLATRRTHTPARETKSYSAPATKRPAPPNNTTHASNTDTSNTTHASITDTSNTTLSSNADTSNMTHTTNADASNTTYMTDTDTSNTTSTFSNTSSANNKLLIQDLVTIFTTPTFKCTKLLRQGGRTCQRIPDGDKKVCLDSTVAPLKTSCIVYSFGIGHDFSFDKAMGQYGCEVFSFDDDIYHDVYKTNMFPGVHFAHIRLGSSLTLMDVVDKTKNITSQQLYRPLDNIMYSLKHLYANLDLLKMDVEGDEWHIFLDSIFQTNILRRTRQLSVEVHMTDFLKPNLQTSQITAAILKYLSFFKGLKSRGFELAYYEPNYINPTLATVEGVTFSVMAEQLWVNTRLQPGHQSTYRFPIDYYVERLQN